MIRLESLASCFQGLIPATLVTCSRAGIPNIAILSHVDYVDSQHVALSFQFFNKSKANVLENPNALVKVIDPDTIQGWQLRLRYVRSETSGPLFERMALRIEAIASYSGLKGIFRLLAADIYQVLSVERVEDEAPRLHVDALSASRAGDPVFTVQALQDLADRIHRADSLDVLLDSILEGIEAAFGFNHSMILVPAADESTLITLASRGYADSGVGSEVRLGEGIAGLVAEARKPIRISGLMRQMLYAYAVRQRASEQGLCPLVRSIPLPGLSSPDSQLGVPLLNRGELIGVLCIESELPYRFHEEDKTAIELLGSYLAIAIHSMLLQERSESALEASPGPVAPSPLPALAKPSGAPAHEIAYYSADECILVDGEYLVRSLPAKILWKLLNVWQTSKRAEFTNRELRLDKSLNLPEWKDNLESRLLLLRRRLEQRCPGVRIVPKGRGRFGLDVASQVVLVQKP